MFSLCDSLDSCTMDSGNTDVFYKLIDATVVDPRQLHEKTFQII